MNHVDLLNVSGGKDSTAMYLQAIEWGKPFQAVFADVGNEHDLTLDFVERLAERTGGPEVQIVRRVFSEDEFAKKREFVKTKWAEVGSPPELLDEALDLLRPTGNPFLDSCLLMSGFPAVRMRFCTEKLKIRPILDQVYRPIWDAGKDLFSWQGIRRDESRARLKMAMSETKRYPHQPRDRRVVLFRPLLHWSIADVWAMHRRHNLKPNPLYGMGSSRVGCYPCIFSRKAELRNIAERHPEHIDRIERWERLISKVQYKQIATFFPAVRLAGGQPIDPDKHGIREAVKWSRTARGGKQEDCIPPPTLDGYPCDDDTRFLGLCE